MAALGFWVPDEGFYVRGEVGGEGDGAQEEVCVWAGEGGV